MPITRLNITGLLITCNEEKNIEQALGCLDFCSEIIVVDAFSTDRTTELAEKFPNTKVIKKEFTDFTTQRNFALDAAQTDWVLFLDGDERITPSLRQEILKVLTSESPCDAYYFSRKFFFENRPIHFSGTQNDKNFRLFRKSKARYRLDKKVHETLQVNGTIGTLKNKLLHYSVESACNYEKKMRHYAFLKGQELAAQGKKYNKVVQLAKTAFQFLKTYIIKLGILDGKDGLKIAKLHSYYVYKTFESLKRHARK